MTLQRHWRFWSTMLVSANDASHSNLAARSKETFTARYTKIVGKIAARGAIPVLMTILPFEQNGPFGAAWFDITEIRYFNSFIRSFAELRNYPLVDIYATFVGPEGYMPAGRTIDGAHLGNRAYRDLYYAGFEPAPTMGSAQRGKPRGGADTRSD